MDDNSLKYQNLILENREKLSITGILDVFSFDDQVIIAETELGLLTIKGENLKITKLSIETQDFIIEGFINSLVYSEVDASLKKGKSFISKLFR